MIVNILILIHIDPWKKYPDYSEGLKWSIKMIEFCHELNPKIGFEVGTEQSIRVFSPQDLENFIKDLKEKSSCISVQAN